MYQTEDELLKAAIIKKNNDNIYSFFSNRVIIPIISNSNKVFGFGARTVGDDMRHWKGKIFGPVST